MKDIKLNLYVVVHEKKLHYNYIYFVIKLRRLVTIT